MRFCCTFIFWRFNLFIFREREKEGERERNISAWLPHTCPGWPSNQRHFGPQASDQSTESHQPGHVVLSLTTQRNTLLLPTVFSAAVFLRTCLSYTHTHTHTEFLTKPCARHFVAKNWTNASYSYSTNFLKKILN